MSAALATELVLAREQKLHALDGLAAAAAHELGTPLGTIVLVTRELEHALKEDSRFAEDVALLRSQAQRCREILQKLTRRPSEEDPLHARLIVRELIEEAAGPYRLLGVAVEIAAGPASEAPARRRASPSATAAPASSTASATSSRTPWTSPAPGSRCGPNGARRRSS